MAQITKEDAQALQIRRDVIEGKLIIWEVGMDLERASYWARPIIMGLNSFRQDDFMIAWSLAEIRAKLPRDLRRVDREENDDPSLIEKWF